MDRLDARTRLLLAALLLAFGGVLAFRVGVPPLASRAEERCADVVANMVSSGDWLVPRHRGELRLQKPPLFYWEASATGLTAGRTTLTTLRAPSTVLAVLLVALVFIWGRSLGGNRRGLLAAAALVMMQSMYALGRIGTAEMTLSFCCTLALFTFDRLGSRQRAGLLPLFALGLALAILAKATVALLVVGLPIAVFLVGERRWRCALAPRVLGWVGLAVAAGFAWHLIVICVVPGGWRVFYGELVLPVGVRAGGSEQSATHYGPVWEYFGTILNAAFPAVLLTPLVVRRALTARFWRHDRRERFLGVIFVSLFVAFSLIPQKQKHYLLPLLPSLALLLAESFEHLLSEPPALVRRVLLALALPAAAVGLVVLAGIRIFYGEVFGWSAWAWGGAVLAGALLIGVLLRSAWTGRAGRFAALAAAATLATGFLWYGSVDIWRRQFEDGSVASRPDYDAARWQAAFQRHPFLAREFRPRERNY